MAAFRRDPGQRAGEHVHLAALVQGEDELVLPPFHLAARLEAQRLGPLGDGLRHVQVGRLADFRAERLFLVAVGHQAAPVAEDAVTGARQDAEFV